MIFVREERPADVGPVRKVNLEAFGQPAEADIVDRLRESCEDLLSLVAVQDDRVVGYVLFSPVRIEGSRAVEGMGLGPMAVSPDYQRRGIGSLLIQAGIEALKSRGCPFIIVLGHPEYYPRFGFQRASMFGIRSQWVEVPDEAFMILILDHRAIKGVSGIGIYRDEFDEAA